MTELHSDLDLRWDYSSCYGQLAIDGHSMHGPGWNLPNLSALWGTPLVRGADRLLPGVAGVKPYRRRKTVTAYSLPFLVNGHWDRFGVPYADVDAGLEANMAWLNDFVLLPTNVGDGTRSAVWTLPSGNTVTADVHVLGIAPPELLPNAVLRTTLELSVPGGDLHL